MKEKIIYALGFFDGVHRGHQALLDSCRCLAAEQGCKAGVITFTNHPDTLISGKSQALLNTPQDRKRLINAWGIDAVVELPFDETLMRTHWSKFLTAVVEVGGAGFVCGSDFRFGAGGIGTAKKLAAYCESRQLPYKIVPQQVLEDVRISSTYIRQLVEKGEMERAVEFLGHPHILTGTVVSGKKLGRTMGVPTANLLLPRGIIEPKHGVYACKAVVRGKVYTAVTNIGCRPTVDGQGVTVEPWLLDFEGQLYGETITLALYAFLRPERKFDSLQDLKAEVEKNGEQTRKFFEKQEKFSLQLEKLMI